MAFVDNSTQSPEVAGLVPAPGSAPVSAGGQGIAAGTTKAASTPGVNVPQQPSAQLKDYLAANAPQTTQYAGQIAGQLGTQTQAAQAGIQPAVNAYGASLYSVPTNAEVNQQVASNPSQLTQQQTNAFQQELNAGQNAPNVANTFETTKPYADLTSNIQDAVNQANLWNAGNNVPSLTAAVQPFENPNSTAGVRTLDALLLSQTPGAYSQIQQATAPAAGLQGQLQAGATQADTALQGAIAQDIGASQSANQAAQDYATNLTNYLNNSVANATNAGQALQTSVNADLATGNLTAQDAAGLGLTQNQINALNNDIQATNAAMQPADMGALNLSQYINSVNPNAANLASSQDYANVQALQNLLGANAPQLPISATTASQAGTGNTPVALNYQDAVQASQLYQQMAPLQQQANAVQNEINSAVKAYGINHFGGKSPGEFNAIISQWSSQLSDLNDKIAELRTQIPAGVA